MTTTATATRKAPAKKAPAKAAPKPAPKKQAEATADKLRWSYPEGRDKRADHPQTATAGDREYAITPTGDGKWRATCKRAGKTETLADAVSKGRAYTAVVAHNKEAAK